MESDEPHVTQRELDLRLANMQLSLTDIQQQLRRMNGTIAELSRWRWFVAGGVTAMAFILAIFAIYAIELAR